MIHLTCKHTGTSQLYINHSLTTRTTTTQLFLKCYNAAEQDKIAPGLDETSAKYSQFWRT